MRNNPQGSRYGSPTGPRSNMFTNNYSPLTAGFVGYPSSPAHARALGGYGGRSRSSRTSVSNSGYGGNIGGTNEMDMIQKGSELAAQGTRRAEKFATDEWGSLHSTAQSQKSVLDALQQGKFSDMYRHYDRGYGDITSQIDQNKIDQEAAITRYGDRVGEALQRLDAPPRDGGYIDELYAREKPKFDAVQQERFDTASQLAQNYGQELKQIYGDAKEEELANIAQVKQESTAVVEDFMKNIGQFKQQQTNVLEKAYADKVAANEKFGQSAKEANKQALFDMLGTIGQNTAGGGFSPQMQAVAQQSKALAQRLNQDLAIEEKQAALASQITDGFTRATQALGASVLGSQQNATNMINNIIKQAGDKKTVLGKQTADALATTVTNMNNALLQASNYKQDQAANWIKQHIVDKIGWDRNFREKDIVLAQTLGGMDVETVRQAGREKLQAVVDKVNKVAQLFSDNANTRIEIHREYYQQLMQAYQNLYERRFNALDKEITDRQNLFRDRVDVIAGFRNRRNQLQDSVLGAAMG